jgi:hypothetical protein
LLTLAHSEPLASARGLRGLRCERVAPRRRAERGTMTDGCTDEGPACGPLTRCARGRRPVLTPCGRTLPRRRRLLTSPRWHTPW